MFWKKPHYLYEYKTRWFNTSRYDTEYFDQLLNQEVKMGWWVKSTWMGKDEKLGSREGLFVMFERPYLRPSIP